MSFFFSGVFFFFFFFFFCVAGEKGLLRFPFPTSKFILFIFISIETHAAQQ